MRSALLFVGLLLPALPCARAQAPFIKGALSREIIGPRQTLLDLQDHIDHRLPRLPEFKTPAEWDGYASKLRASILSDVVFRGEALKWRDAKTRVELLETIPGGDGYKITKVRYEVLPGMWIPAILYEPEKVSGKVPVALAVNGHDGKGKAAEYKQIRCINLAKRGLIVLNVEWFGMGQLKGPGYRHYSMNQLDLCGTSGVAPFYLAMTRGIDLLLSRPGADPDRVTVAGLSGGGWQTIFVSSLDTRVTLANPVAGYSGFRVKYRDHFKDLGDSEQAPCDLGTLADYTHLTALRAPRPTLLTYNIKDDCCFEAGYALPPLLKAAGPVFALHGKPEALRSHVNEDPGTHNFEKDNRQAYYRMIGDFFFPGEKTYKAEEIPCAKEVKSLAELTVKLPAENADFNTLASRLARDLPRDGELPGTKPAALAWQVSKREALRGRVKPFELTAKVLDSRSEEKDGLEATFLKLDLGGWKVPVVELSKGKPKATLILLDDKGRKETGEAVEKLLASGWRVVAVDPIFFGESKLPQRDFLFALLLSCLGDRALGLEAGQVRAVARWAAERHGGSVTVRATGPRLSLVALVAAALEEKAIARVELEGSFGTLKEVIEANRGVDQLPEVFCFGLLEVADVKQIAALCAPRQVVLLKPSERARKELAGLKAWYALLGLDHDPAR